VNFFPPVESVSCRQSVDECVSVVNARRIVNCCKTMERLEQRYCIKFYQKLGDTQVETIRKIQQAFGDDAMSITRKKEWYNCFNDGSTSVDSEPCHGRPSTSRNDVFPRFSVRLPYPHPPTLFNSIVILLCFSSLRILIKFTIKIYINKSD
jgi:hypothetical protein